MLLEDVVYLVEEFVPCSIFRSRTIGRKAVSDLRADPHLVQVQYQDEDIWDDRTLPLITGIGMCLASCQLIEHYIASSFLLGVSKQQKKKYETIDDLRKGWRAKTLGNMIRSMEEAWELEPLLKANLEMFLSNRNLLVHGILTDDRFDIQTRWGQDELVAFLSFFDIHARIVKSAFRASYYASIHFAIHHWGRPANLTRKMFGRKHEKEAAKFAIFFKPKEDAI